MSTWVRIILLLGLGVILGVLLATAMIGRERLLTLLYGPIAFVTIDFRTLQRHARPNQYLVCPPQVCATTPDMVSPIYNVTVTVLRDAWLEMISQQPRVKRRIVSEDELQCDFVQRSRLLRFPDTITVRFIPLGPTTSTLAIYSRSHYGYSDFGVNRRRIETWLASLGARVPMASP
jgi:uncharacterized protein (DUF1499 family)